MKRFLIDILNVVLFVVITVALWITYLAFTPDSTTTSSDDIVMAEKGR